MIDQALAVVIVDLELTAAVLKREKPQGQRSIRTTMAMAPKEELSLRE